MLYERKLSFQKSENNPSILGFREEFSSLNL